MQQVLISNQVFTGINDTPVPGAILVEGNKIIKIASSIEELKPLLNENVLVHNFDDQLVMAGFHDFHLHLFPGALQLQSVDLSENKSAEEVIQVLKRDWDQHQHKDWIIGFGWDNGGWEDTALPTKELLDVHFPNHPIILNHLECHYCWVNSKALELAEITKETPDPEFGEIIKDENGEITGILMEKAQSLVQKLAYNFSKEEKTSMLNNFFDYTARHGITSLNDMYAPFSEFLDDFDLLYELEGSKQLKARVHLQPKMDGSLDQARLFKEQYNHPKIKMNGLKQFIDGVITGHTAYMLEDYTDASHRGHTTYPLQQLEEWIIEADKNGFSVRLHAIGDGAVKFSLDAFEKARNLNGSQKTRHTIEHIESIRDEDIPRFKELNVIASVQPYHLAALEQKVYLERLGEERFKNTYLSKSFIKAGAMVALGSDFPVVHISPMKEIYHAITRKDSTLVNDWNTNESLSMTETLKAYTYAPAYGCFREDNLGTLEEGKLADIIVLNKNLFEIPSEEILETEVVFTMCDGEVVYELKGAIV
ncbi:amidohydrolase [Solibacillus sp. FSL K6-1523]|uniref:amidohydrolase n=1 Tax=Solibacillus sp. FSL K6-1523 TaxID=2921471 RepID=UPI0030FAE327